MKPKYGEKAKLCYMATDSFTVYIKIEDIYVNNSKHVETRFDTSNYELERSLPKEKNKKVIILLKDELGGKMMNRLATLGVKSYSYLPDNNDKDKKSKRAQEIVAEKENLNFKTIAFV